MNIIREWFDRHLSDRQVVVLAFVLLVGFGGILYFGDMLAPALVSLVLAYLMEGVVLQLRRWRLPRGLSVAIVYSVFLLAFFGLLFGFMPRLFVQVERFVSEVPKNLELVQKKVEDLKQTHPEWFIPKEEDDVLGNAIKAAYRQGGLPGTEANGGANGQRVMVLTPEATRELAQLLAPAVLEQLREQYPDTLVEAPAPETSPEEPSEPEIVAPDESDAPAETEAETEDALFGGGFISAQFLDDLVRDLGTRIVQYSGKAVTISLAAGSGVLMFFIYALLVPLMVFFFLKDKDRILGWCRQFMPRDSNLVQQVWRDVDMQIGNYVRGKVLEIIIVGLVSWATFMVLDLDYAMLLALGVGFSVLVPYLGATVMALPVILVAFFQFGTGAEWYWTIGCYMVIQLLDGNVLAPLLFSEVTNLHPVAIILAVLVFGGLWGFWGVFFAIPLATLVQAVLRAWPRLDPVAVEAPAAALE